jgi:hypothetical protein
MNRHFFGYIFISNIPVSASIPSPNSGKSVLVNLPNITYAELVIEKTTEFRCARSRFIITLFHDNTPLVVRYPSILSSEHVVSSGFSLQLFWISIIILSQLANTSSASLSAGLSPIQFKFASHWAIRSICASSKSNLSCDICADAGIGIATMASPLDNNKRVITSRCDFNVYSIEKMGRYFFV